MLATTNSIQKNPTAEKNTNPPSSDAPSWALGDRRGELFPTLAYILTRGVQRLTKIKWIETINGQLSALGVQEPAYIPAIETLAGILEQRDKTFKEFKASGGKSVIEYTNKGGSTNMTKNPLLVLWDDLNKSALAYWRELGLTPSSYKKMTGDAPKKEKPQGLVEVLSKLEAS